MKRIIALLMVAAMAVGSQILHAAEKNDTSLSFWERLSAKIEQMAPQKKVSATTAVGGVRGANIAADDVYWKGEKAPQAIDADELQTFKSAMTLAAAGDMVKAQAAFSDFVAKNPESPLRKDADQALAQLQTAK